MFKSFLSWLVGDVPISRWILILILLGMLYSIWYSANKTTKRSDENG